MQIGLENSTTTIQTKILEYLGLGIYGDRLKPEDDKHKRIELDENTYRYLFDIYKDLILKDPCCNAIRNFLNDERLHYGESTPTGCLFLQESLNDIGGQANYNQAQLPLYEQLAICIGKILYIFSTELTKRVPWRKDVSTYFYRIISEVIANNYPTDGFRDSNIDIVRRCNQAILIESIYKFRSIEAQSHSKIMIDLTSTIPVSLQSETEFPILNLETALTNATQNFANKTGISNRKRYNQNTYLSTEAPSDVVDTSILPNKTYAPKKMPNSFFTHYGREKSHPSKKQKTSGEIKNHFSTQTMFASHTLEAPVCLETNQHSIKANHHPDCIRAKIFRYLGINDQGNHLAPKRSGKRKDTPDHICQKLREKYQEQIANDKSCIEIQKFLNDRRIEKYDDSTDMGSAFLKECVKQIVGYDQEGQSLIAILMINIGRIIHKLSVQFSQKADMREQGTQYFYRIISEIIAGYDPTNSSHDHSTFKKKCDKTIIIECCYKYKSETRKPLSKQEAPIMPKPSSHSIYPKLLTSSPIVQAMKSQPMLSVTSSTPASNQLPSENPSTVLSRLVNKPPSIYNKMTPNFLAESDASESDKEQLFAP